MTNETRKLAPARHAMKNVFRLALVTASILALATPALARSAVKPHAKSGQYTLGHTSLVTAPVGMQEGSPYQMVPALGWRTASFDRASSPYAGVGH